MPRGRLDCSTGARLEGRNGRCATGDTLAVRPRRPRLPTPQRRLLLPPLRPRQALCTTATPSPLPRPGLPSRLHERQRHDHWQ